MRDQSCRDPSGGRFEAAYSVRPRASTQNHNAQAARTSCAMELRNFLKRVRLSHRIMKKDTAPAELRKLAVQAVKHKATIDDANFKKRELRETLVRLQEALEERRAEERRIAEEAASCEERGAPRLRKKKRAGAPSEERLAAEAEAEESEESEEEDEEPEPEQQAPEAGRRVIRGGRRRRRRAHAGADARRPRRAWYGSLHGAGRRANRCRRRARRRRRSSR